MTTTPETLRELAQRGVGYDKNPTMMFTTAESMYSQWLDYFTRLDQEWRARVAAAADALSTPPADDVREALALTIAKSFPGWIEDTAEPVHVGWSEALRLSAEQHNERVNQECLRQGRAYADAVLANRAFEVRTRGTATDVEVEAAAQAMFEDPLTPGDYTWAQMVAEDPTRADIWRADARRVLEAAREACS